MLAMLSFLACTLFPLNILNIPKVNADAQEDLNNSLTWAKAYLDRSYTEFGTTDYNWIHNPGFEYWTVTQPDDWNIRVCSNIAKESSIVHTGLYSIKLGPAAVTGTVISPGTWTPTLSVSRTYSYSAWIRYDAFPSVEYRMGINTESSDGHSVYIEMGVVGDGYGHAQTFAAVIENDEYIYGIYTSDQETGVWTNWNTTITGNTIEWFYGGYNIGTFTYTKLASKPMIPDIVLPGAPMEANPLYVDDTFFGLLEASSAGMRDLPGLPFVMQDVTDDKWMCPAKATQAVQDGNDGPDWGYYGGCGIDVIDYGYDSDRLKLQYRWDTECDSTFDGVVMYVELITLDNGSMKCYANITSKTDSDHCALWLDNETVIDPVTLGYTFERTKDYGWFTTRFVVRHGTKIAANMYNALGETDKATKLLNLWYGSGYTKDTYDGIWAASNDYADYEMGYPWAANPFVVMPDPDMWGDIPWFQMSQEGTEHSGIPYRSQLQNEVVRMLGFQTGPGISLGKSWWECGFTFKMAWACHLLNKYNTSDASKLAEAKQLIDDVSWNGLGISSETLRVGSLLVSLYAYACYVPYADAEYLAALTKYWQLTGDEVYGQRADEVAGILLKVQVKPGDKIRVTDSNGDIRLIWRPDNTGGFMCGYKYGGGFDFGSSPFWLADKYFWCTMALGLYNRDYAELSSCGWTNHETTLMSYAALYKYSQTGRTPLTSSVDFTMPFFDAQASTSHSDHGCDSIQADKSGNIRTFLSESAYGESWSTVTYSWTVELPALTNFRTKLTVYIPYYGQDGNAVERWVLIYKGNVTAGPCPLLVSDYDKPIDAVGGYGEKYIIYTNMTLLDSLSAGIYTFKRRFRFSCGWAGEFAVGYRYDYLMRPTEPMHIETFGCNFDAVPIPLTPKYYVHIRSSGPGTVSPFGDYIVDEGTIISSTATPFTATMTEYNNVTTQYNQAFYQTFWCAQTFTTTSAYYIAAVKLWLWKSGTGTLGTVTVGLRDTSGGVPIGGDLASGTLSGLAITTEPSGAWYTITFTTYYPASANHTYAIVVDACYSSGDCGYWKYVNTGDPYPNGDGFWSSNSGGTWTSKGCDYDFEVWGTNTPTPTSFFWFWIINNTRLGLYYYSPLETLSFTVDHDYNVTAYFGNVDYTLKGTYPLTIRADITMGGTVDGRDIAWAARLFGATSSWEYWESSLADAIDKLLYPDGKIDGKDLSIVCKYFGRIAP
jgi:hypothetical protein